MKSVFITLGLLASLSAYAQGTPQENELPVAPVAPNAVESEEVSDMVAEKPAEPTKKQGSVKVKNLVFKVDLAQTPGEWQKGLMFRDSLGPKQGMLFISNEEKMHFFWMKNTLIPLDILFLSKDKKIVHMATNAPAMSEERIPSVFPAQYILEVPAGTAKKYKLKNGDKVIFIDIP